VKHNGGPIVMWECFVGRKDEGCTIVEGIVTNERRFNTQPPEKGFEFNQDNNLKSTSILR
jgi:hypothetical protein